MTWPDNGASAAARQQMAAALTGGRVSEWTEAFAAIPRHVFVPRFYQQDSTGAWQSLTWGDPGYLESIYSDEALTTQLDDQGVPTSSSSQPSVMLRMLEALDVEEGHQVLELGTGTGYNAALLSHRVGDKSVTSVDIDYELVKAAGDHLDTVGLRPFVACADGAQGWPDRAPYDRVIATVGLHSIPGPLLDQAAPGAVIVVPLGYGIVRVTVTEPGHASGRFLTPAYFMARRSNGVAPRFDEVAQQQPTDTSVPPGDLLDRLKFPASLAFPGYVSCSWKDPGGTLESVGLWTPDGSTATVHVSGAVRQCGPRRLWDVVEELAESFTGTPDLEDFQLTISPAGQVVSYGVGGGPSWALPATP
ncbi:methyltransferase domain-containing protein [Streptomyces sp. Vc74B-19]|uniref:methyltransferase domain-containing protein n=1 Tax=Streptomyces sp. Vc74B-19 TaxID=2741324 RepID=UPI001BFCA221|nr:methyltransferase domain-containing protein [Streptomyces sp. Vc74B-19]MBT3161543.1 methyltransferase domain-containing protein [Streptomyces sp. Vc74B-19]